MPRFCTGFIHDCFEEIDFSIDHLGGISVKVYELSQKRRGDRSQMYNLFEKERDIHKSEVW